MILPFQPPKSKGSQTRGIRPDRLMAFKRLPEFFGPLAGKLEI